MTQSLARTDSSLSLDRLRQVLFDLQAAPDITTLGETVTTYIQNQLGYELVWLGLYDPSSSTLNGPLQTYPDDTSDSKSISVLPGDLFDQVLLTRRNSTVPSLQEESRVGPWQALAKKLGIQGAVIQNIRYRKDSLGVLLIGTSKWGINPRQEESEQFAMLANALGATLQHLHSLASNRLEGLPEANSTDQTLVILLRTLTQSPSWESQLTSISHSLKGLAPISGFYLLDTDQGDFVSYHIETGQGKRTFRSRKQRQTLSFHQNISFFKALERQSSIETSDIHGNVGALVPNALVTVLTGRAFLFHPILVHKKLKGFLVLGHPDPHHWSPIDKDNLALCAHLVELTYPNDAESSTQHETLEESLSRLTACALPSPLSEPEDWDLGVNNWFKSLLQRFQCQWSILLTYDPQSDSYKVTKYCSTNRRAALEKTTAFKALSSVDQKLIIRHDRAIDIESLQNDLRLVVWHDQLLSQGIQSILVSRLSPGSNLDQFFILGNTSARAWRPEEADDLQTLAYQFQTANQRRRIHVGMLREKRLNLYFRQGLQLLQTTRSSQAFVEQTAKILVELFEVSGCGILLWPPQRKFAKVKALVTLRPDQFSVPSGTKIELNDALIQTLLQPAYHDHTCLNPAELSSASLSEETKRWLLTQDNWSILGVPLQPQPKQPVFGVLFLVHSQPISLSNYEKETLSDFARHMGWVLWSSHVTEAWRKDYEALHTAHWYHNKTLDFSFKNMLQHCQMLQGLSGSDPIAPPNAVDVIAELDQSLTALNTQNAKFIQPLQIEMRAITLVRLLREVLDRLEAPFAAKQIWVQVHHLKQSNLALRSSKVHLMHVLDEVLKAATLRSEVGGRIDIWCQMNQPEWLDLSITDSGVLDQRLIRDLNLGHLRDRLKPSLAAADLGHRLLACQSLIQTLEGKLIFQSLEDKRTLTRFTLPCIVDS